MKNLNETQCININQWRKGLNELSKEGTKGQENKEETKNEEHGKGESGIPVSTVV